jgi:hypothetical protein
MIAWGPVRFFVDTFRDLYIFKVLKSGGEYISDMKSPHVYVEVGLGIPLTNLTFEFRSRDPARMHQMQQEMFNFVIRSLPVTFQPT